MIQSRRLGAYPELCRASEQGSTAIIIGASGDHVAALQDLLVDLGAEMPRSRRRGKFDGIFGEETRQKIRDFQSRTGLKPDGMVGPRTLASLDDLVMKHRRLETPGPQEVAEQRIRDFRYRYQHLG